MAERRFTPYVTIVLAAVNVIVFGVELALGGDLVGGPRPPEMFELGGNFGPATLGGEPWRLLTSMFLHYGIIHLAANMYFGMYGLRQLEQMYGRPSYLALYVVSGLAGSLVSAVRAHGVSAGASGAVFGLIGGLAAYLLIHRHRIDQAALKRQVSSLAFLIGINLYLGFQSRVIDMAAHLGGLVAGFALGLALEYGHRLEPGLGRRRAIRALVVGVAGTALVVAATLVVPNPGGRLLGDPIPATVRDAEREYTQLGKVATTEMAGAIEGTALPAWRRAVGDVERATELPDDMHALLLRYARARRDELDLMAQAIRADDQALVDRALERRAEANAAVTELNEKFGEKE